MKKFFESLTPEKEQYYKNWYIWEQHTLKKLVDQPNDELTAENFRVIFIQGDKREIATVKDIEFFDPKNKDFDFAIGDEYDYFLRDSTPKEVVEFLDKVLNKSQYEDNQ